MRLSTFGERAQRTLQGEHALLDEVDNIRTNSGCAVARLPDDLIEGPGDTRDAVNAGHRRAANQRVQRPHRFLVDRVGPELVGARKASDEHVEMA